MPLSAVRAFSAFHPNQNTYLYAVPPRGISEWPPSHAASREKVLFKSEYTDNVPDMRSMRRHFER